MLPVGQTSWKLFSVVIRATPLLPHFVRHYASIGFTDWIVAVHPSCQHMDWKSLAALSPMRIHREACYPWPQNGLRDSLWVNGLRAKCISSPDEWHAMADIDEFYEYPMPLAELTEAATEANCIVGEFVDRVALDGSLPPVKSNIELSEQFPARTCLTRSLLQSENRKVMLCRGEQALSGGHHYMLKEKIFIRQGFVHHYKWNSEVIKHLTAKKGASARQLHESYALQMRKFIEYIEQHERIRVDDFPEPSKYRLKFVLKDGRKLYPGTGNSYQYVAADNLQAAIIRATIASGAYTPSLSTFVVGEDMRGYIGIDHAELEPTNAPVDAEALGPIFRKT
jgi:hypothetical protein